MEDLSIGGPLAIQGCGHSGAATGRRPPRGGSGPLPRTIPPGFFARPAEVVAPELLGCLLLKRQADGALLWGVIVETEAYCQSEPACHGHRRRSASNDTLFGESGRFYVYLTYGVYHCVNVVTGRCDWANGVLLRAAALPGEPERVAAGPGLLARRFGLDRGHDGTVASPASGLWLAHRPCEVAGVVQTQRIGLSQGQDLPWRWYLRGSRSVSRRARGDRTPRQDGLLARLASTVGTFDGSRTP
ncbi:MULTISPECIES: DNA-3-methyladenine glycosylase [unclassified Cyanobium]|uniref:DNA-3-methyladenine glycosylase n=1 Tax=unclassified Cyanobium TaxID=2627006 RepID=UPI0020CED528|nr:MULTISPECIES: DNA-3-methyladenine glycosylase [unclassified Cyanobium]MCP9835801.1 DNA-3-methyladenine glycosylase [Cyanobium sp. La Preciosa 7G6]MCP9938567.1 DNA-3-methyladenine glycosylase [Cyanobium sp. Aljojuca 7A6]